MYLLQEYEHEIVAMKKSYETMRMDKDRLQEEMSRLRDKYDHDIAEVDAANVQSPGQSELYTLYM